jgi:HEAT repeat protein
VVTSVGAEQSVPLLLRASADAAPAVRAEAILGLGSIDDERGRERVEAALSDPNVEVRRAAADACSTLCRSATAFEKLVELALREETTARMLLPRQSLRVAIQGEGAELVRAAILSQTQPMLAPKATDSQRGRAALLLADAGSVLAPELLTATVRADVDDALRAQAALALGATGDNDAVAALREALDSHKLPTAIACRSLQDMAARGVPGAGLAHADCLPDRPK